MLSRLHFFVSIMFSILWHVLILEHLFQPLIYDVKSWRARRFVQCRHLKFNIKPNFTTLLGTSVSRMSLSETFFLRAPPLRVHNQIKLFRINPMCIDFSTWRREGHRERVSKAFFRHTTRNSNGIGNFSYNKPYHDI